MAERFRKVAGVRVQRNRIMRTRPIFPDWAANLEIEYGSVPHKCPII